MDKSGVVGDGGGQEVSLNQYTVRINRAASGNAPSYKTIHRALAFASPSTWFSPSVFANSVKLNLPFKNDSSK